MRKLIVILLIAVIACTEVDTTPKEEVSDFNEFLDLLDLDVNSVELSWIDDIGNKIAGYFGYMWESAKSSIQWLKDNGVWDQLVEYAKSGAKNLANSFCTRYCSPFICTPLIDAIFALF